LSGARKRTSEQDRELIALGRAVRQLRDERDMSDGKLAAAAGLTPGRLAAIEAARFDPPYDVLLALARGLGVKPAELVRRADAEAKDGHA
jgi:transcriptional regulator with XRE-family HTH domain